MMTLPEFPLYEPKPTDRLYTLTSGHSDGAVINLDAITYYASLSLKPRRIGHLVGCNHNTIWGTYVLREAYEHGAALHELWLRAIAVEAAPKTPELAYKMLGRSVGTEEQDVNEGRDPEEGVNSEHQWVMQAPVFQKPQGLSESEKAELEGDAEDE